MMRRSLTFFLATLLALVFPAIAHASFAPANRPTFQCVNQATENCPGPNYVVFNSFINSPVPDAPANGDERAFFEGKDAAGSTSTQTGFGDGVSVRDGERVTLKIYIHNDANPNLMGETNAIAHNTVVSVQLPNTNTTSSQATAFISSDNSQPRMISDTLDFSAGSAFSLTFDRSSAVSMTTRTDSGQGDFATNQVSGITFSDDRNMRVILGDWPGGFNRHGILTLTALVHTSTATQAVAATQSVAFNCSSLSATGNTFTAQSNGQAAGVTISSFVFTVKDANGNTVDTQTVTTNAQNAVYNFNQSNPGTYTVNAVINSDKGSTAASACSRQITVASQSSTLSASTTTNNQPAQVPNTGAGDILSVFAGASSVGAIGHYVLNRRR